MEQNISLSGYRVLVVDDQQDVREGTCDMLRIFGAESEGVPGGKAAIEICQKKDFDLILMNTKMRRMNGFKATKAIKELPKYWRSNPPTIMAYTDSLYERVEKRIKSSGMDGYISKQLSAKAFIKIVSLVRFYSEK